jgi:hypothetical protein
LSKVPDTPEWILVHVVAVIPRPIGEITAQSAVIPDLVAENRRRPFTPAQRDIVLRLIADRTPTAQAASAARLLAPLCGARAHRD